MDPNATPPNVNTADTTGAHKLIFITTCKKQDCHDINCADNNITGCPNRTALQNQTSVPPTSQGFETKIVGNYTSRLPSNNKTAGTLLDVNKNYSNQLKPQWMVTEEPAPVAVDSKNIIFDPQSTKFAQEPNHFDAIKKTL